MPQRKRVRGPRHIYVLLDAHRHIRYVGQTGNPDKRLRYHWTGRLRMKPGPLKDWLLSLGERPGIMSLQVVDYDQADAAERYWISLLAQVPGVDLLNSWHNGYSHSAEWRAKVGTKARERGVPPETFEKFMAAGNASKVGRAVSPETRRKIADAQRGRVFSEEHRANLRAAQQRRFQRDREGAHEA